MMLPKPRPILLDRADTKRDREQIDKAESAKVKARSGGRCEVTIGGVRCMRRASEVHHHLGGWGRRGRGDSALAEQNARVQRPSPADYRTRPDACAREYLSRILRLTGGAPWNWSPCGVDHLSVPASRRD